MSALLKAWLSPNQKGAGVVITEAIRTFSKDQNNVCFSQKHRRGASPIHAEGAPMLPMYTDSSLRGWLRRKAPAGVGTTEEFVLLFSLKGLRILRPSRE